MTAPIIVTTTPFGREDERPLRLLEKAGLAVDLNPFERRLRPDEVADVIGEHAVVIAGTEPITGHVIARCSNLRAICRVGIGLDGVDLIAARENDIAVTYTPDGPSPAVAELTIGLMIDCLRHVYLSDRGLRAGHWSRQAGRRLAECTVGIVGVGRIGGRVLKHLAGGFPGVQLRAYDIAPPENFPQLEGLKWVTNIESILQECDVVSLHVPLTPDTNNLISKESLSLMKEDAVIINTARGGIVNETDLADALTNNRLSAAAIDVFVEEPYTGPLIDVENALLTCHMGSMSEDCRAAMEIEATRDAIRFLNGETLLNAVPSSEYLLSSATRTAGDR